MTLTQTRRVVVVLLVISTALLIPGIFAPVLTIRGILTRDGVAHAAPQLLEGGLNDETVEVLTSMLNPAMVGMVRALGGDVRTMIIEKLTPELTRSLQANMHEIEVYHQTRSILGAVRQLYDVGSPVPATLILLFSVIVPMTKGGLVGWAVFAAGEEQRRRTLAFVETIAKWSMADVFVVALFIAYLAAHATGRVTGADGGPPMLAFTAHFGPGFYWFAAYCLFSLASQQYTARIAGRAAEGRRHEQPRMSAEGRR